MIYTKHIKIVKGGRKSVKMDLDDFKKLIRAEIIEALKRDNGATTAEAEEELDVIKDEAQFISYLINVYSGDIEFDTENISSRDDYINIAKGEGNIRDILGFHEEKGFCYLGINAGGDWENPIFFILYYDGEKIDFYIPKAGNTFNPDTNSAFGNNEEPVEDDEGSVYLMKKDFLSKIEIDGIPVIDL